MEPKIYEVGIAVDFGMTGSGELTNMFYAFLHLID